MGDTVRAFTAIDLDDRVAAQLGTVQDELRQLTSGVRWVRRDSLHVTLQFLGEIDAAALADYEEVMRAAAAGCPPFSMRIEGIGSFPPRGAPRVVWAGVSSGATEVAGLARRLSAGLQSLDYEPENRPFRPHITLGRVRNPRGLGELGERIARGFAIAAVDQPVHRVRLKRSRLTPSGAIYDTLLDVPLGAASS